MSKASSSALLAAPLLEEDQIVPTGLDLVERARAGDMRAWAQLYQRHFDRVCRRLAFFVGRATIAEDLTQETFARAIVSIRTFDGRSSFSTWICAIAGNVARNYLRSQETQRRATRRLAECADLLHPGEDGERVQLRRARCAALYGALEELPEHLREAFVLREVEGLTMREAAAQAGVSTNNMTVRAWRARTKIRRSLGRLGWLHDDPPATKVTTADDGVRG